LTKSFDWTLIETPEQLEQFYQQNKSAPWLAFDTEFIPERYYHNKLCLISVATPNGNYVIDVIKNPSIKPFIKLLESPEILKITHAGENDYQILLIDYKVRPRNIFDTQLAYGFIHYEYPMGLQFLVERELRQYITKVELRSDWERRPLAHKQLNYAVSDVAYLFPLMKVIEEKLSKEGKLDWAKEECRRWEHPDTFQVNPIDYYNNLPLRNLSKKQKLFLIRLHNWRKKEARHTNRPTTGIIKTRFLKTIVKGIAGGKNALFSDRTLPQGILKQNWHYFQQLYQQEASSEEQELLIQLPDEQYIPPDRQVVSEMLHQLIKMKAAHRSVSPNLIIPKKDINKMKSDPHYFPTFLEQGWRKKLLGQGLLEWIKKRNTIDAQMDGHTCILTMQE
jgi:ribonuclease D